MVARYDKDGAKLGEYQDVISFDKTYVEYINAGYRAKIYANADEGEYFDDPDNPLPPAPPEPEPQPDEGAQQILDILKGVTE